MNIGNMAKGMNDVQAWIHDVVQDDGEADHALSFSPDSFPLQGVGGFRSIRARPLYTAAPTEILLAYENMIADHARLQQQLAAAREALQAAEADAARYRWLREHGNSFFNAANYRASESMDAAIDAALNPGGSRECHDTIEKIVAEMRAKTSWLSSVASDNVNAWADRLDYLRQGAEGDPVAWTVVGPDGKSSIGGWSDMSSHRVMSEIGILRDGHRYAYAYEANPAPPDSGEK